MTDQEDFASEGFLASRQAFIDRLEKVQKAMMDPTQYDDPADYQKVLGLLRIDQWLDHMRTHLDSMEEALGEPRSPDDFATADEDAAELYHELRVFGSTLNVFHRDSMTLDPVCPKYPFGIITALVQIEIDEADQQNQIIQAAINLIGGRVARGLQDIDLDDHRPGGYL